MKAAERKRKRLEEMNKQKEKELYKKPTKKRFISMPPQKDKLMINNKNNFNEINSHNKIENIAPSRPANNVDPEKIEQRMKDRKERKRIKKLIESGISPIFIQNNNNTNNNQNDNNNVIENNINNNGDVDSNNIKQKESNKLGYSSESMAPLAGKKVNFNLPINKKLNENFNFANYNFNNNNDIRHSSSSNSNSNNNDITSASSAPNYSVLTKNYANIKNENVEEFLKKTNPKKPSDERKEAEVQRMIEIMNLRPNPKNGNNKTNANDSDNYAYNLTQKIEGTTDDYYTTQKEIKDLKEQVREEESKMNQMLERNKIEIQNNIEKIIELQNKLINSKQGDIVALEEANKIDVIQMNNLSVTLKRLKEENEKERTQMFNLINKEILPLKKELKNEILEVQRLKKQLLQWNKKAPPKDLLRKIEVVMKYMKHCT
jgi:hypothetical protein